MTISHELRSSVSWDEIVDLVKVAKRVTILNKDCEPCEIVEFRDGRIKSYGCFTWILYEPGEEQA